MKCEDCKYWYQYEIRFDWFDSVGGGTNEKDLTQGGRKRFPKVELKEHDDWCGEFKEREKDEGK